jgi:large subunit ribosomal protein L28
VFPLAKCDVCCQGQHFGLADSHSHRQSTRAWKPNVIKVRLEVDGTSRTMNICARCLRASRMTKSV